MKRDGGTQPRDWNYDLAEGVTTRQVTFYVDGGTPLYGKLFFPKGSRRAARYPAVVVGHGINALSIGIEKYAARFAERGLVAMAIDYQSYGFSGSGSDDLRLLEPDTTTDDAPGDREAGAPAAQAHQSQQRPRGRRTSARPCRFCRASPASIRIASASGARATAAASSSPSPAPTRASRPWCRRYRRRARRRARAVTIAPANARRCDHARPHRPGRRSRRRLLVPEQGRSVEQHAQPRRAGRRARSIRFGRPRAVLFLPAENDELTGGADGAVAAAQFLTGAAYRRRRSSSRA